MPRRKVVASCPAERPDPMQLVAELLPRIKRVLRKACRSAVSDPSMADDAMSDVVLERAARIVELWDPKFKVPLDRYFLRTIRLYAAKWACRERKFVTGRVPREKSTPLSSVRIVPDEDKVDAPVELELILSRLSQYDQWIIKMHAVEGYTFKELRIKLGISKGAVRVHFNQAMRRARELAGSDPEGFQDEEDEGDGE